MIRSPQEVDAQVRLMAGRGQSVGEIQRWLLDDGATDAEMFAALARNGVALPSTSPAGSKAKWVGAGLLGLVVLYLVSQ